MTNFYPSTNSYDSVCFKDKSGGPAFAVEDSQGNSIVSGFKGDEALIDVAYDRERIMAVSFSESGLAVFKSTSREYMAEKMKLAGELCLY